jgi:hypothetical protein
LVASEGDTDLGLAGDLAGGGLDLGEALHIFTVARDPPHLHVLINISLK